MTDSLAIVDTLLLDTPRISQWMLYDTKGSQIYEEIVAMKEYYLPAAERKVIEQNIDDIATPTHQCNSQVVVELGAGAGHRTLKLIERMATKATFTEIVPTDISAEALRENREYYDASPTRGTEDGNSVRYTPLKGTHEAVLSEVATKFAADAVRTFMFMGSSLGNYDDSEIIELIGLVKSYMSEHDRLLVAVDLQHSTTKPSERIVQAYDDPHGITARFTLNALTHVNNVAGLNFEVSKWKHVVEYDKDTARIITHVEALSTQSLMKSGSSNELRRFEQGDRIYIEQSRKFSEAKMHQYAGAVGLNLSRRWSNGDFLIVELRLPDAVEPAK